jgi:hypothetical protein
MIGILCVQLHTPVVDVINEYAYFWSKQKIVVACFLEELSQIGKFYVPSLHNGGHKLHRCIEDSQPLFKSASRYWRRFVTCCWYAMYAAIAPIRGVKRAKNSLMTYAATAATMGHRRAKNNLITFPPFRPSFRAPATAKQL